MRNLAESIGAIAKTSALAGGGAQRLPSKRPDLKSASMVCRKKLEVEASPSWVVISGSEAVR